MRGSSYEGMNLIGPGDRLPLRYAADGSATVDDSALTIRPGDVVRMSVPPAVADIVQVEAYFVVVRWPWTRIQLDGSPVRSEVYIRRHRSDRMPGLWQYDPDPADPGPLRVGDQITVSASGDVWVRYVPAGKSPDLGVLRQGVSIANAGVPGTDHDQRMIIEPYGGEPWSVELLHRPFSWLADGDVVLDANGRRWTFYLPPAWVCLEDGASATSVVRRPVLPLELQYGLLDDPPAAQQVAVVAQGSEDSPGCLQELYDWCQAAGTDPIPAGQDLRMEDEPPLDEDETGEEEARTRVDLLGRAREEIAMDLKTAIDREDAAYAVADADVSGNRIAKIYAGRMAVRRGTIEHVLEQMYLRGIERYTGQEL